MKNFTNFLTEAETYKTFNFTNPDRFIPGANIWLPLLDPAEVAYVYLFSRSVKGLLNIIIERSLSGNILTIDFTWNSQLPLPMVEVEYKIWIQEIDGDPGDRETAPTPDDHILTKIDLLSIKHYSVDGDETTVEKFSDKDFTENDLIAYAINVGIDTADVDDYTVQRYKTKDDKFSPELQKKIVEVTRNELTSNFKSYVKTLSFEQIKDIENFFELDFHKFRGTISGVDFNL